MKKVKEPKWRYIRAIYAGEKVPRKAKKYFLGIKMSRCALSRLLKSVHIMVTDDPKRPSYQNIEILPYTFCPNCGETGVRSFHRSGYYPEVWDTYYCLRCKAKVAEADNSPIVHVLQYDTYCNL